MQLPIPANMEGQGNRNPYSRFNTAFNPRLAASALTMGLLPGPTGIIDRLTGNNLRNQVDRVTGAGAARNQRDYDAYMREMMRNDPGNQGSGVAPTLRDFFGRMFNRGEQQTAPQQPPTPQQMSFQDYMRGSMRGGQGGLDNAVGRFAPTLGGGVGSGGGSRTSSVGGYISGPAAQEMFAGMREGSMDQQNRGLARQAMDRNFVQ
jgi:hypothetical protein